MFIIKFVGIFFQKICFYRLEKCILKLRIMIWTIRHFKHTCVCPGIYKNKSIIERHGAPCLRKYGNHLCEKIGFGHLKTVNHPFMYANRQLSIFVLQKVSKFSWDYNGPK